MIELHPDIRWRDHIAAFFRWMREKRGWKRDWIIVGQRVTCIGIIGGIPAPHNDNGAP